MYNLLFGKESQVACHLVQMDRVRRVGRASEDGMGIPCEEETGVSRAILFALVLPFIPMLLDIQQEIIL